MTIQKKSPSTIDKKTKSFNKPNEKHVKLYKEKFQNYNKAHIIKPT